MHPLRAAFGAWRSYRGAGIGLRAFLAARLAVLPLRALAREFTLLEGRVLGVGSGHGLLARWIAELNPGVTVDGYDVDPERVAVAKRTQALAPRVRIHQLDVRELHEEAAFDAAVAIDLLHHVPAADHASLAEALARAVRPAGLLLIKDIALTPRWKHRWNVLHDRLVTGGWDNHSREPEQWSDLFADAGFDTERCYRMAPLSLYPHFMLRLRRRPAPSELPPPHR